LQDASSTQTKNREKTEKKKRETPNPFSNLIIHTQDYNEQRHIRGGGGGLLNGALGTKTNPI
jgi:hypothetical protein